MAFHGGTQACRSGIISRLECPGDNTIAAFAEGTLGADSMARVDAHARSCAHCQELLSLAMAAGATGAAPASVVQPPESGGLARGTSIGRYTILALIGRGGMGEVYAAYDPELDRKVALKVLRADSVPDASQGQARLLREAKAMAKVAHPNVVSVHDAGSFSTSVFIAMDFVDGATLRDWLAERPRSRDEILAVFISAAHGLMAAHAAGLVHRDFKPGNVMIARNGDVRVTDFGLARSLTDTDVGDVREALPDGGGDPRATLTVTGQMAGTPRYMAPEQFRAEPTDARTDQFGFCVSLYEALYGVPPFGEGSVPALSAAVLAGRVQNAPPKSTVPAWLRRVLLRGLSAAPADRWPSMRELVAALAHDPARVRRRWSLALGAALLVGLPTIFFLARQPRSASLCRGGPARMAGAWEPPGPDGGAGSRRDAVQRAFLASDAPGAKDVWMRVAAQLDHYAAGWLAMYEGTCVATHVRGEQPANVLDLRMSCLDDRRTALAALTGLFMKADKDVVANAVDAANALPDIARCGDVAALRATVEPPRDVATRTRAEKLREQLATAKATNDTGKHRDAIALSERLVAEARQLGYRPLLAEALDILANSNNNMQLGLPIFEEAFFTAFGAGRDDLAARNAVQITGALALFSARLEASEYWSRLAHALVDERGQGTDLIRAWLAQNEGLLKRRENDPAAALDLLRKARALKERALPQGHPDIASSAFTEADILNSLGRHEEALALNQQASRMWTAAYGPSSMEVAYGLSNRGDYLVDLARPGEAIAPLQRAISIFEEFLGRDEVRVAYPLTALGRALLDLNRAKEAVAVLTRALGIREAHEGNASMVAETRFALAKALWSAGADRERARELAIQARSQYRAVSDKAHEEAVETWLQGHAR